MLEQLGPAVDAQVAYLREQARASYRPQAGQHTTGWQWLGRRLHRTHR